MQLEEVVVVDPKPPWPLVEEVGYGGSTTTSEQPSPVEIEVNLTTATQVEGASRLTPSITSMSV